MRRGPIVYRVQDAEGRGPWRPGFSHRWVEHRPDHDNLRPWIEEFGPVHRRVATWERAGCGCRTLDQLRRWFSASEYQTLLGHGYQAVRMEVGCILAESKVQLVFSRTEPLTQGAEAVDLYTLAESSHD